MSDDPTWHDLRGRNYASAGRRITGTMRATVGGSEFTERFWYAPPGCWRTERDGTPCIVYGPAGQFHRTPDGGMERQPDNSYTMWGGGHPSQLTEAFRMWEIGQTGEPPVEPDGAPRAVSVRGRDAWQVRIRDPRLGNTIDVTFDDATGVVVALELAEGSMRLELLDFELDPQIPDETFAWTGPYTERPDEWLLRREQLQRIAERGLPAPTYWPTGFRVDLSGGDPDTGTLTMDLAVNGGAQLTRWPAAAKAPQELDYGGYPHEVRWEDRGWKWCLRSGHELTDEELSRVKELIPHQEPSTPAKAHPGPDPTGGQGALVAFDDRINVAYGQFYLAEPGTSSEDMADGFVGQRNGLCGTAEPGVAWFVTGLHTGTVALTVEAVADEPPVDASWEEIVEAPLTVVGSDGLEVQEWGGDVVGDRIPLPAGTYRVRYCAAGIDAGHETDSGDGPDRYRVTIWPAAPAPDAVVRQTSQNAAYWHTAWN
ncbi:hypothetical protein [Rhodococcus sp. SGAir0479]|uniref:hypothetical protein n=1 Tax=Rhodococcus sp. SGAir0479 TaxID=2567884 RepID=UPI0010CCEBDD|nr:hypothetical protein [Rhodococcus sp. SGAir0479]QCQ92576.1 hypothetical protein E7742_16025 [Rhodococcus sp. SGAir0479]